MNRKWLSELAINDPTAFTVIASSAKHDERSNKSMVSLPDQIGRLRIHFIRELQEAASAKELEDIKLKYLGKKGPVQALMMALKDCSADERPHMGNRRGHFIRQKTRGRSAESNLRSLSSNRIRSHGRGPGPLKWRPARVR